MEEHLISYFEFKGPTPSVSVDFLVALSGSHPFSDHLNLISGGLDQFRPNSQGFTDLLPTEWGSAPPPTHSNTRLGTIVVGELDQR